MRRTNEDSWVALVDAPGPAFAVFDGMGGEKHGQAAARAAADALPRVLQDGRAADDVLAALNDAVCQTGGKTTAVVYVAAEERLLSVGDSAVYALDRSRGAVRLNPVDRAGRHVVTDCLGDPAMRGHAGRVRVPVGAAMVLCSDGVDDVVGPAALVPVLGAPSERAAAELDKLLHTVDAAGAPDNATVVLARRLA